VKTLTAALILEKNKLANTVPWITLLRVTLDDATVLRLAAYPEDVTFDSEVYTAFPCMVEAIGEVSSGNIGTLRVAVANVDKSISAYVENNDLLGNAVTVRVVHGAHLVISTDKIDFTYKINRITITEDVATFDLGHEDLVKLQVPRQRYLRGRCRFIYGDTQCGYPGDEFGLTTKQTLKHLATSAATEKINGWSIVYGNECDAYDISVTTEGYLTIRNNTGAVKEWWDAKRETAYAYKLVTGDFDVETLLVNTAWTADGLWAMFLAQSNSTASAWVALAWAHDVSTVASRVVALSTALSTAGTVENDASSTWYRYARLVRAGNTITWYVKAASVDAWTALHSETRSDLGSQVRIGFTTCPRASGAATTTVQWDYLRVNAGGMPTCDYTLDGANGCREHKNTLHYGGFPAIPSGRLYGV
jgi:hypothetical protein